MSHSATLSPSPIGFLGGASFFSAPRFTPTPSNDNLERRRTSHPHNGYLQRGSEEMAERSQSQHRPRLEHRASQTIIDLTDEPEEQSVPPRNAPPRNRALQPPHLGRSDAVNLGDLIDLTDDSADQDVIITGAIQRQLPTPRLPRPGPAAAASPRAESPSLFLPAHRRPAINRVFPAEPHGLGGIVIGPARIERVGGDFGAGIGFRVIQRDLMDQINFMRHGHVQAMPDGMNYQHPAFAERKPEHVGPPPAREGFTRSPKEDDILVCPSCEEELIQNKEVEEPVLKKSGKAPTKKEREEHPFWVVKECGHVYCNACFQHRTKQGFIEHTKPSGSKKAKVLACAVDDCECDVRSKDKWVGVFL